MGFVCSFYIAHWLPPLFKEPFDSNCHLGKLIFITAPALFPSYYYCGKNHQIPSHLEARMPGARSLFEPAGKPVPPPPTKRSENRAGSPQKAPERSQLNLHFLSMHPCFVTPTSLQKAEFSWDAQQETGLAVGLWGLPLLNSRSPTPVNINLSGQAQVIKKYYFFVFL